MSKTFSLFALFLFFSFTSAHELHHKAFRALKAPKINKNRLSLIIQRLKMNETTKFSGAASCPMFQSFSPCACEPTCNNPNPICPTCEPGCTCRNGFVRSSLRMCVLPEECPRTKLRRFEMAPPRRLYEAVPVALISTTTTTTEEPTTPEPPTTSTEPPTTSSEPPTTTTERPTTTTEIMEVVDEMVTVPLIVLRNGPTPPSAPPMLQAPSSDMVGAPAATPPPDFSYGPPGMNAAKFALYEDFLKRKRIMRALRHRRNQFAKKML